MCIRDSLLRAVGSNELLVTSLAKDKGNVKILGLGISNGLVALSGSVCLLYTSEICERHGFYNEKVFRRMFRELSVSYTHLICRLSMSVIRFRGIPAAAKALFFK